MSISSGHNAFRAIKIAHTFIWAIFAGSIIAIPIFSLMNAHHIAFILISIVSIEVLILIFNSMSCPLTSIAARYTNDRRNNFDIYLPEWVARHNKALFGSLYIAGIFITVFRWTMDHV